VLYALLVSLPWAGVVAYLLHSHRAEVRERHAALVAERAVWHQLERDLLNKIQAPVAAQKQAAIEVAKPNLEDPPFVGWDNDDEFHEARGVEV
jgi:hypothetical protein